MKKKLCIFGLSADPLTYSHFSIIKELSKNFDKVIVVPNLTTYYRNNFFMFTFDYRIYLINAILNKQNLVNVEVSRIEEKLKKSHTYIDTLLAIKKLLKKYKNYEYYTAIGADSYNNFTTWVKWEKILKNTKLVVFPRKGYEIISNNKVPYNLLKISDNNYIDDGSATKYRNIISNNIKDFILNKKMN